MDVQEQQRQRLEEQTQQLLALQSQQPQQQLAAQTVVLQPCFMQQQPLTAQQQMMLQQRMVQQGVAARGQLQQQQQQYSYQAIPGLPEALTEALKPVAHMERGWSFDEMVKRVQSYFTKAAKKYEPDKRKHLRASTLEARALIEEFVETAMSALTAACYEKAWVSVADFSGALMVAAMHTFRDGSVFCRILGPLLKRYIDESICKYNEEERVQKVMYDAISVSGLLENLHKRALKNLSAAFDEAHMSAPYGQYISQSQQLGAAQAFVRFWMEEFTSKSWDMLEGSLSGGFEQSAWLANLFKYLIDPDRSVLPPDVAAQSPVPQNWDFVEVQAREVLSRLVSQPFRKRTRF